MAHPNPRPTPTSEPPQRFRGAEAETGARGGLAQPFHPEWRSVRRVRTRAGRAHRASRERTLCPDKVAPSRSKVEAESEWERLEKQSISSGCSRAHPQWREAADRGSGRLRCTFVGSDGQRSQSSSMQGHGPSPGESPCVAFRERAQPRLLRTSTPNAGAPRDVIGDHPSHSQAFAGSTANRLRRSPRG
jgi:hypothetical protein